MNDNNRMLLRYVAEGDIRKAQMQAKVILNSITAAKDEQFKANCLAKLNNVEPRFIELPVQHAGSFGGRRCIRFSRTEVSHS